MASKLTPAAPTGPAAARQRIIDAAVVEFRLHGLEGTTMGAIADRAGIRRSNLYRYVESKTELLSQVLIQQVRAIHAARRVAGSFDGPVGPIIVRALEQEHKLARTDELMKLARSAEIEPHTAQLLRTDDALFRATSEFWEPLLTYGRARNEIRLDLADRDVIRWFFLVQYMLIVNEAIFRDQREIRHYLRRMVAASILRDPQSV